MKKFLFIVFALLQLHAFNQSIPQNSANVYASVQQLNVLGSVLYIAAHPDDENTRLLAYFANERKYRTAYLSITRGDGGQNLIGKEQGEPLGIIRTQELLAARKIDGAEQFFTRANDFGYSKNPEETFSIWNKDSILADIVWVIRNFKPDVIICRFPTTGEGGHGHHTASAILAEEAFDAAADPKKFPNQLKYVDTWQTKRLFWNTFNFGGTNTTAPDQLTLDVGVYNSTLGKGYGEIAADSRSMHKSQGFGSAKTRGSTLEYFKQLKGETVQKDLFENIQTTWLRLGQDKTILTIDKKIKMLQHSFTMEPMATYLNQLILLYKTIASLKNTNALTPFWQSQKLNALQRILVEYAGIWTETNANVFAVTPGTNINMQAQFVVRNNFPVLLKSIRYFGKTDTTLNLNSKNNTLYTFKHQETIDAQTPFSDPYWLKTEHDQGLFTVTNQTLIGQAQNNAFTGAVFTIDIAGLTLNLITPLVYKYTDPVKGEIYRSLEILPPVTLHVSDNILVFNNNKPKTVLLSLTANQAKLSGKINIQLPTGWTYSLKDPDFSFTAKDEIKTFPIEITPASTTSHETAEFSVTLDNTTYNKSIKRIEYDHIPYQFMLSPCKLKLLRIDANLINTNIAYIAGAGDEVMDCLQQIGYTVTLLNEEDLANANLNAYAAIVTGVRAYNTNAFLQTHYQKLMHYVQNGGNLIVQYNTNSRVGPVPPKIGPYAFTVSRERVTNEKAAVTFLLPNHSILNYPNKITDTDFEGWVQERGIYFATETKDNYQCILSTNDAGETNANGSLICCPYGKGNFVYTGLAFFRQLPAGVPGAYRLFTNLIALPQNK